MVCSRQEWVAVYNHRAQIRDETPRFVAEALTSYDVTPAGPDDAEDMVLQWAEGEIDGPGYICANCVTPFAGREVGA